MAYYTDLDLDLNKHPNTGDITRKTDVEAIKQSIKNILLTNKFEKPFNPDYGVGIRNMLFDTFTPAWDSLVSRVIIEQLTLYEKRIELEDVEILTEPDSYEAVITLTFYVKGLPDAYKFNYRLERVR